MIEFKVVLFTISTWVGSGSAWIRNFCLDTDPELGKFRAGSGSGINQSGSTTLLERTVPVPVPHLTYLGFMTKVPIESYRYILKLNS